MISKEEQKTKPKCPTCNSEMILIHRNKPELRHYRCTKCTHTFKEEQISPNTVPAHAAERPEEFDY